MSLQTYLKRTDTPMPTTPEECKPLFSRLACSMSPENLTCDGELPNAEVKKKVTLLSKAWRDLEKVFGSRVDEGEVWDWV